MKLMPIIEIIGINIYVNYIPNKIITSFPPKVDYKKGGKISLECVEKYRGCSHSEKRE